MRGVTGSQAWVLRPSVHSAASGDGGGPMEASPVGIGSRRCYSRVLGLRAGAGEVETTHPAESHPPGDGGFRELSAWGARPLPRCVVLVLSLLPSPCLVFGTSGWAPTP